MGFSVGDRILAQFDYLTGNEYEIRKGDLCIVTRPPYPHPAPHRQYELIDFLNKQGKEMTGRLDDFILLERAVNVESKN